jgi:hypothetical protein
MKKEHPLVQAARMMDHLRPASTGRYEFIALDGHLWLQKKDHRQKAHRVIYDITAHQINNGLTPAEWGCLESRILTAGREGILK